MESQKDNNFKNYFENLLDYQSNTIGKSKNFYDKFSKKESNKKHTLVGKNPCIHDSTKSGGGILPWTNTSYEDYMGFRKKIYIYIYYVSQATPQATPQIKSLNPNQPSRETTKQ